MKITDDYKAKVKLVSRNPRVVAAPRAEGFPPFGHKKFRSHVEMNAWKKELILDAMRRGGVRWKKS